MLRVDQLQVARAKCDQHSEEEHYQRVVILLAQDRLDDEEDDEHHRQGTGKFGLAVISVDEHLHSGPRPDQEHAVETEQAENTEVEMS